VSRVRPAALIAVGGAVLALATTVAGCSLVGPGGEDPQPAPAAAASPSGSAATAAADPAGLRRFYTQQVDWQPCQEGLECASVAVPLDYADPDGAVISLALLRVPALDPDRRVGSLVVDPGGPGVSAQDYAAAADQIVSPSVREVYDVVGMDPRGVGGSTPLECIDDAGMDASVALDATPDTDAEVQALLAGTADFVAGCQRSSADLLPHVGTADVARDLDVVRAVLGDDRLNYLGKSYGTSIGTEYARQFPARVGRLVLDGAVDPTLSDADVLLGQAEGFELALSRFAEDCVARGCALGDTVDEVVAVAAAVLDRADESPIPTGTDRPLTQTLATYGIIYPLYLTPQEGYPVLEAGLAAAARRDGSILLQVADAYLLRTPDGRYETNQWDAFTPISCLDRPGSATVADVQAALPQFEAASPLFGEGQAWGLLSCSTWPVAADGLPAPVSAAGAAPILVVGTTGDPATPYAWAQGLADQLDSGVLLTYEGTPHTAYRKGSSCVDDAVDAYLLEGIPPPDGTTCR
jgi:pimeloyl-ACP methyl ester carboxylesterase